MMLSSYLYGAVAYVVAGYACASIVERHRLVVGVAWPVFAAGLILATSWRAVRGTWRLARRGPGACRERGWGGPVHVRAQRSRDGERPDGLPALGRPRRMVEGTTPRRRGAR